MNIISRGSCNIFDIFTDKYTTAYWALGNEFMCDNRTLRHFAKCASARCSVIYIVLVLSRCDAHCRCIAQLLTKTQAWFQLSLSV